MIEKISRNAAFKIGKTRYFTGIPCINGHTSEKLTSNGKCIVCNKEKLKLNRKKLKQAAKSSERFNDGPSSNIVHLTDEEKSGLDLDNSSSDFAHITPKKIK